MTIERASQPTQELVHAFARLLPQLSPGRETPDFQALTEMMAATGTNLFVARDGDGTIVGTLMLHVYRMPSGLKARIDDVVVDAEARGHGVGEALTRAAMEHAGTAGVRIVELSARPHREAANRLYRRLGFERRKTNVYVWRP